MQVDFADVRRDHLVAGAGPLDRRGQRIDHGAVGAVGNQQANRAAFQRVGPEGLAWLPVELKEQLCLAQRTSSDMLIVV